MILSHRHVAAYLMAVVLAAPLRAQAAPAARVAEFFDALGTRRWLDAARLVHPERLESFHAQEMSALIAYVKLRAQLDEAGIRDPMRHHFLIRYEPTLRPESLAVYADKPLLGLGPARTVAAANALPPADFMAYSFAAREYESNWLFYTRLERAPRHVIGTVIESDTVAHVVYRVGSPHLYQNHRDPADAEVLQMRLRQGSWYLWPNYENFDFGHPALRQLQLTLDAGGRPRKE